MRDTHLHWNTQAVLLFSPVRELGRSLPVMHIIKSLVGGLIGAFLGSFVWLGFESALGRPMFWLMIVSGLFAGVGVRLLVQPPNRNLVTGVIAAGCTIAGLLVGNVFWSQSQQPALGPNPAIAQRIADSQDEMQAKIQQAEVEAAAEAARLAEEARLAAEEGDVADSEDAEAANVASPSADDGIDPVAKSANFRRPPSDFSPAEIVAYSISMLSALVLAMTGGTREPIVHHEPVDEPAAS